MEYQISEQFNFFKFGMRELVKKLCKFGGLVGHLFDIKPIMRNNIPSF